MLDSLFAAGIGQLLDSLSSYFEKDTEPNDKPFKLSFFFMLRGLDENLRWIFDNHLTLKKILHGLKYDRSKPNQLKISVLLNGEREWTTIKLNYSKLDDIANKIQITSLTVTKPWLEKLVNSYLLEILFTDLGDQKYSMDSTFYKFLP